MVKINAFRAPLHRQDDSSAGLGAGSNLEARESGMEDEVQAIVKLRGFPAGCPLALQLKALDVEYHSLIEAGQSAKADHVQNLFLWKSKAATASGATAQRAESEESPLGQASLKYLDAFSISDSKAATNYHVSQRSRSCLMASQSDFLPTHAFLLQFGRILVIQGRFKEAVSRLESCLSWNPKHESARVCLGIALASLEEGPGPRAAEAIQYLQEGVQLLLVQLAKEAMDSSDHM